MLGTLCPTCYSAANTNPPASTGAATLKDKFNAGDYWSVGSDGLEFLKKQSGDDQLRLLVADSLAWSGRYADAIRQYQMLAGTTLADSAALGLANVYRWSGRPDLASPLYQQILRSQPENPDALDGLNKSIASYAPANATPAENPTQCVTQGHRNQLLLRGTILPQIPTSLNTSHAASVDTHQREINSIEHADMAMVPKLDLPPAGTKQQSICIIAAQTC
jgi:tetratricopeptide (TPR) repeat protein